MRASVQPPTLRRHPVSEGEPMTSYPAPRPAHRETDGGYKLLALFLGLVVCVMGFFGLWLALSAQHASDDASRAAASAAQPAAPSSDMSGMPATTAAGRATPSYAGVAPANADAL